MSWFLKSSALSAVRLIAVACTVESRFSAVTTISSSPADSLVAAASAGALLIDVRGSDAFAAGHIPNARSVPGATIAEGAATIGRFKEKPIIAYCDSGRTSMIAVRHLGRLGFKQTYNLRGGLAAWRADNLPVEKG